jgi:predicted short-subunit dehydrogenase-like oxidoreductase (DUF2520 family)
MHNNIKKIAFAGAGNVAWHLAQAFKLQGFQISGIWSRNNQHATALANSCGSVSCSSISDLRNGTDLIIIAVPDKAIANVARSIGKFDGIVVHTAGSVPMNVFADNFEHFGVFYPVQTFSKEIPLIFNDIPILLELSSDDVMQKINYLAQKLSTRVLVADTNQRLMLHVAAVFACNYSNLMYIISNDLLKHTKLPTEVLHTLILETARKAVAGDPLIMQTGPARRDDTVTIEKHIEALASLPEYAELYRLLAKLIGKKY